MKNSRIKKLNRFLFTSVALYGLSIAPTQGLSAKPTSGEKIVEKEYSKKECDCQKSTDVSKSKSLQGAYDISKGFSELAQKAIPTVVNVSTTQIIEGRDKVFPQLPPGSPLDDMFKDFFDHMEKSPRRVQSLGTGFIVKVEDKGEDSYAYIVTNYHVIADAKKITIVTHDNTELEATIKAIDERTDVALLEVKTGSLNQDKSTPLKAIEWGDSNDTKVGDWCIAIGNPFGLGNTVTNGVISNRSRNIGIRGGGDLGKKSHISEYVDDFLQHSASINMGNSGGPLFDLDGKVIGVNTAIFSPSGGNVGIGFAIPSNLVKETVKQLIEFGRTKRGWLGVKIQPVTDEMAESFGFERGQRGAVVSSVTPKGPAAEAGIEPRDLILEFDGKKINDKNRLQRIVGETEVGKKVKVKILRKDSKGQNKEIELIIAIAEFETANENTIVDEQAKESTPPSDIKEVLGMKISKITGTLARKFDIKEDMKGAVIVAINGDSPAVPFLKPGDVIIDVNRKEVNSPEEVIQAVEDEKKKNKRKNITFLINHGGEIAYVTIKNEDDLRSDKKPTIGKHRDKETDKGTDPKSENKDTDDKDKSSPDKEKPSIGKHKEKNPSSKSTMKSSSDADSQGEANIDIPPL